MTYMAPSGKDIVFSCNLRCLLICLHGRSRTHRVASLRAGPVGRILYNLYFNCELVRYVTCDLINEYTRYISSIETYGMREVVKRHI